MARKPAKAKTLTAAAERIALTPELVEGLVEMFLHERFDAPKETPQFHRDLWEIFCNPSRHIAVAAPRGHAKSTAGTHSYGLAALLFGEVDFAVIVSATEALSASHLANMTVELTENEPLIATFDIQVLKANETELVARCGGREFCVIAKGAEQKVRGIKWRQKRPQLILIDDLEEDEAVMSPERRLKLREWFYNALLPVGSDNAKFIMVGTILHLDSMLERLLNDPTWYSRRFRAHADYDDFSELLWPEKFTKDRLLGIRRQYETQGNPSGYSQEYLSAPIAEADAYFRRIDFQEMTDSDRATRKTFYGAIDFAISKAQKADNTAFTIGGVDKDKMLHIVHTHAARLDSLEIIDKWFELHEIYQPDFWVVEAGMIEKTLGPFLKEEMVRRGVYMNLIPKRPDKDKQSRARGIQARMRAGGVRFDMEDEGYAGLHAEMLSFPRGVHDDRVDSIAWLGLALDNLVEAPTDAEASDEEWADFDAEFGRDEGRSETTGY